MHSRIYQITTSPVLADEYLAECDFYEHWFVGSIADSVSGGLNRDEELRAFREFLEKDKAAVFCGDDSFTIPQGGKEIYFKDAFTRFSEAIKKVAVMSLEDFADSGEFSDQVRQIRNSYCENFGYYVSSEEFDTIPLDEFIRYTKPGTTYYIGGILDYHW